MEDYNIEHDWKIYRANIARWQENYMSKLLCEYKKIIDIPLNPSERFWQLHERIKNDRRKPCVLIESKRSILFDNLAELLNDEAITLDDLSQFSEYAQEKVKLYCGLK